MTQNMLSASLKTCHWGYFDAKLPPAMTISSGDEVVINTISGGPQNLPGAGFYVPQELLDLQVTHERMTKYGRFHAGLGYGRLEDLETGTSTSEVSGFIQWSSN